MKQINAKQPYSEYPQNLNDITNDFDHFLKILTVETNEEQPSIIPEIKIIDDISSSDSFDMLEQHFITSVNNNFSSQENLYNNNKTLEVQSQVLSTLGCLSAPGSPGSNSEFSSPEEQRARSQSAPSSPLSSDGGESYTSRTSLILEENISAQICNNPAYKYDPRPLGRKRRRNLVPQDKKTREYWERRQRNNVAARRSREERRNKELETYQKMKVLEKENTSLRESLDNFMRSQYDLQNELQYLRQLVNNGSL